MSLRTSAIDHFYLVCDALTRRRDSRTTPSRQLSHDERPAGQLLVNSLPKLLFRIDRPASWKSSSLTARARPDAFNVPRDLTLT